VARGSIEQVRNGFRARVYAGKDPITGKQGYLRGQVRPTRGEAEKDCARLLAQVEAEQLPEQAATLSTLLDRWMEVADHELSTRDATEGYVRRTIRPALGDMPLRKLQYRVDIFDRFYTHLRRCNGLCDGRPHLDHRGDGEHDCTAAKCRPHVCRGMAPGSVRRIHGILSAALGYGVSWGWIEKNPAEYSHPPKQQRARARPPEAGQVARLLNLAWQTDVELGVFLWLATTTGARRGELVGLRWDSVDLAAATVRIERSYVVRGGQRALKGTKTDRDRRLSLDGVTVQMLVDFREQRRVQLAPAHLTLAADAFLFSPEPACARPWHPDHFTHQHRKLADVLGIKEPLKNLRHFNATQLLAAGVDLRTTAGRLGHADGGATTLRVYADWLPATDRRAAEQLAADLGALRAAQVVEGGAGAEGLDGAEGVAGGGTADVAGDSVAADGRVRTAVAGGAASGETARNDGSKRAQRGRGRAAGRPAPGRQAASSTARRGAGTSTVGLPRAARPLEEVFDARPVQAETYLDVTAAVREAAAAGRLQPGDLLPTVTELAAWFGVARSTAQRAVSKLAAESAITKAGGRWKLKS